ncbi:hypothetical protein HPO96_10330 [Kribbella sandramycini]|uniref:Uncharacterized protein n=1 Tax=Kribbella sandramycini TaxID=60450 RepID=A0A7Y4NYK9_9ACTN|nr:hypothetical protein [Kribbella sandramycini]MBB6569525.1 hypothetical protein [Kribbella sandramycini]NOL40641.1 hypothetical protein [Kribbella sandramycini]
MAARENIFVLAGWSVPDEVKSLAQVLGLEPIPDTSGAGPDQYGLRGPAQTVQGVLGYLIQPNLHAEPNPAPEDVQAIDGFQIEIDIWLGGDEAVQRHEARLVFDRLVAARPEVGMALTHDLDELVAAYRPGYGVHVFPPGTTMDAPYAEQWRGWVPETRS